MSALHGRWLQASAVDMAFSAVIPWSLVQISLSLQKRSEEAVSKEQIKLPKTDPSCCFPGLPPPGRAGPLQGESPGQPLFV